jgi:hypothetical protein
MLRETTHADLISVVIPGVVTLSVQAALTFQKYRFDNGLMLGITLAAVDWYEDVARRRNARRPSRITLILVVTAAAATTVVLQQVVHALAAALPLFVTHS